MQSSVTIFQATRDCRLRLLECQNLTRLSDGDWAETRLADFNLWADGIGALLRNDKSSLDSRLTGLPDARDVVINLVDLLRQSVEECKSQALGETTLPNDTTNNQPRGRSLQSGTQDRPPRAFSPWSESGILSDSEDLDTQTGVGDIEPSIDLLSQAMASVKVQIDQLARLSMAIRTSGTRTRLQKADSSFDHDS